MAGNLWTREELAALKSDYPTGGAHRVRARIQRLGSDRTLASIRLKASQLGVASEHRADPTSTGPVTIRLTPALVRALDTERGDVTRSQFIRDALTRVLQGA